MKGYPKTLNSKKDYLYVREHFSREQWLPDFQALLDSYQDWFFEKHLETKDEGIEDNTHKIVEFENTETEEITYDQYEFRVNPTAKLFRLGFTVEELEALIAE